MVGLGDVTTGGTVAGVAGVSAVGAVGGVGVTGVVTTVGRVGVTTTGGGLWGGLTGTGRPLAGDVTGALGRVALGVEAVGLTAIVGGSEIVDIGG